MDAPPGRRACVVCHARAGRHCARCQGRRYCSRACQRLDWRGGHRGVCAAVVLGPDALWGGDCGICQHSLPLPRERQAFYACCCTSTCQCCHEACQKVDPRICPMCRTLLLGKPGTNYIDRLKVHAAAGHARATFELGRVLRDSVGGAAEAFPLFECAALQKCARAELAVAQACRNGAGVEADDDMAAYWGKRAANQAFPDAQFFMGELCDEGRGVPFSRRDAFMWYSLAAKRGHAEALYTVGVMYACGHGVRADPPTALEYFKRALFEGHDASAGMIQLLRL